MQKLTGFLAIVIVVAVIYVAIAILANPITANIARVEQAKALQERERTEQIRISEGESTERFQTFALTLTGLVAMAQVGNPLGDMLIILLIGGLWVLAGYVFWLWRQGRL